MKHILSVDQFSIDDLRFIAQESLKHLINDNRHRRCKQSAFLDDGREYSTLAQGLVLANLFYEPSTRTSSSFYSAMVRLGGTVVPINDVTYSSVSKGETLEDTISTMQCYTDMIVLRHHEVGAANRAAVVSENPIINAGDGIGEHPTQALLDFFTILIERRWNGQPLADFFNGMTISMLGDLKHGRTVKSLAKLLRNFDVKINWVSPPQLIIPAEFVGVNDVHTAELNNVIHDTDVLYVTRVQKERMHSLENFSYCVTPAHMTVAKPDMVLMHPLPRVDELPTELDSDPRAAYFRQMRYGLFVRMTMLRMMINEMWNNRSDHPRDAVEQFYDPLGDKF